MAKLILIDCACRSCAASYKCDFYRMACKNQDCSKCQGTMRYGDCKDYEKKV